MSAMSANVTEQAAQLPNPLTPLAFLTPSLASKAEVSQFINAGSLGAFFWDLALSLNSDYVMLFKHRIRLTTAVYYISRVFTLLYIVCCVIFEIGYVDDCQALLRAAGVCYLISGASTSFLFFIRVRAVFHQHRYIIRFFLFLWFSVVAGLSTVPFGISGAHISTTRTCTNEAVAPFTAATFITQIVNDSLVFLAISYKVLSISVHYEGSSLRDKLRLFLRSNLPAVSRALLQGGQQYYLVTVCGNIVVTVMLFVPVPALEHALFTIPNLALGNAMACIVFRQIKFGLIAEDATSHLVASPFYCLPHHKSKDNTAMGGDSDSVGIHSIPPTHLNAFDFGITGNTHVASDCDDIPLEILVPAEKDEGHGRVSSSCSISDCVPLQN